VTRILMLSMGGKVEIPVSEYCNKCGARPRHVTSVDMSGIKNEEYRKEYMYYRCQECGHRWSMLVGGD